MAVSKRTGAAVLAVVASALTITGVVLAATDPYPSGLLKDPFALHGYPPKSADLEVVVSTGQAYSVQSNVNINFQTNRIEARLQIPLVFSSVDFDLRMVDHRLYASTPNLSSVIGTKWLSTKMSLPSLFGYSLEFVKPDIPLISGFSHKTITKNGDYTTYDFSRDNVAVTRLGAVKGELPGVGSLEWSITTGSQGEVTASSLVISSKKSMTEITATVLSYNQPARIEAPPAGQVKSEDAKFLEKLLGSTPIASLLVPQNLTSLGSTTLS
jgi:hypothetical protein